MRPMLLALLLGLVIHNDHVCISANFLACCMTSPLEDKTKSTTVLQCLRGLRASSSIIRCCASYVSGRTSTLTKDEQCGACFIQVCSSWSGPVCPCLRPSSLHDAVSCEHTHMMVPSFQQRKRQSRCAVCIDVHVCVNGVCTSEEVILR